MCYIEVEIFLTCGPSIHPYFLHWHFGIGIVEMRHVGCAQVIQLIQIIFN